MFVERHVPKHTNIKHGRTRALIQDPCAVRVRRPLFRTHATHSHTPFHPSPEPGRGPYSGPLKHIRTLHTRPPAHTHAHTHTQTYTHTHTHPPTHMHTHTHTYTHPHTHTHLWSRTVLRCFCLCASDIQNLCPQLPSSETSATVHLFTFAQELCPECQRPCL